MLSAASDFTAKQQANKSSLSYDTVPCSPTLLSSDALKCTSASCSVSFLHSQRRINSPSGLILLLLFHLLLFLHLPS